MGSIVNEKNYFSFIFVFAVQLFMLGPDFSIKICTFKTKM